MRFSIILGNTLLAPEEFNSIIGNLKPLLGNHDLQEDFSTVQEQRTAFGDIVMIPINDALNMN